ncbi:CDP-glycerol glycerophosphotransferase family protein [uncultured Psychrobacter sp.]|uniref:CDP-glycerol glycerophosphotransferase family protein n=1 Tax=uncultured Psychrobacter sp. TaxID=259303 RepID=UPI003457E5DB
MLPSYLMRKLSSREKKVQFFAKYDAFFPKFHHKAVLVVKRNTEFSGNLRVCADVLLANKRHKVYVYKDGPMPFELEAAIKAQGMVILKHSSWHSFYHLLTSGLMFFSHVPRDAHISIRNKRRVIIGLWHGVAFKNIESQMVFVSPEKLVLIEKNAALYDLMLASSQQDKQYLAKSFMVDESIIEVTGLPRYDLLKKTYPLDTFLNAQKQQLDRVKANRKLVLYAPTFRENCKSHLDQITNTEWTMLNSFMLANNALMGVRPHPYDNKHPPAIFSSLSNMAWLDHDEFTESNLVLQHSDILVVDFSSIWIDYLLLNRPIIGFAKDFEHYRDAERGFAYEFADTFPDVFVDNIEELINRLDSLLSNGMQVRDYSAAKQLFHAYDLSTDFSIKLKQAIKPYLDS